MDTLAPLLGYRTKAAAFAAEGAEVRQDCSAGEAEGSRADAASPRQVREGAPPSCRDRSDSHHRFRRGHSTVGLASTSIDLSKHAQLVRYGAYAFMWVIGIWALINLLTTFSGVLKPLVLAALMASILEWMVQFWEYIFWKLGNFISLCFRKLYVLLRISSIGLCGSCHLCLSIFRERKRRRSFDWHARSRKWVIELCDWKPLLSKWHGSYAGQNPALRFMAVCFTLAIVVALIVATHALLMSNVSHMLDKLSGYKNTLMAFVSYLREHAQSLPEVMPANYQNQTRQAVQELEQYMAAESMVHKFEEYVSALLQDVLAQTESIAMGTMFFLLYTFLWLFVPMHVNSHEVKAKTFRLAYFQNPTVSHVVEGEDEPLSEVQERIYKVVWQYFFSMILINATYAAAVFALLMSIGVDMSVFIAIACFFLSFIPELGTIICTILPLPLVALEPLQGDVQCSRHRCHADLENPFADWSERSIKLWQALGGMVAIKLLVANVLTSIVMGRNRTLSGAVRSERHTHAEDGTGMIEENVRETHPVVILFFVVLTGEIWGAVGMLISVPVVSLIRLAMNVWYLDRTVSGGGTAAKL